MSRLLLSRNTRHFALPLMLSVMRQHAMQFISFPLLNSRGRLMPRLALIVACAMLAGCSTSGWRTQKIEGGTESAFEESVASLQERLPPHRRAEFDTALAVIWMRDATVGAGDLDSDGRVDVDEIRALQTVAEGVLADIRRGVFVSAREGAQSLDAYLRQLDGLGYDDVISLAAPTGGDVFSDAVRQREVEIRCGGWRQVQSGSRNVYHQESIKSPVMSRYCARR
jgi:hypothetical protein